LRSSDRDRCNRHAETTFFLQTAGDDVLDDLRAACKGDGEAFMGPPPTDRNQEAA
jgi:hypothetical protein